MAKYLIKDLSSIHICSDRHLPPELAGRAISAAMEERADNLVATQPRAPHGALMAGALAALPHPVRMAVVTKKLWKPGRVLRVRYLSKPSAHVAERIEHYARQWSEYANITFQFVKKGSAEIRISFDMADGSWSHLGTDAKLIAPAQATMNYGWLTDDTDDDEFSRVVLHEFGHALGAIHEHNHPDGEIAWNKPAVYEYYRRTNGWSKADVDDQVFATYAHAILNTSNYDRLSIMHYAIPPELLKAGANPVGWNRRLSATDKKFIRSQYKP